LVAPWLDPDGEHTKNFFDDFEIDPDLVSRTKGTTIFNSNNDQESVQKTVEILKSTIKGIEYKELHNRGHFYLHDENSSEFPELLEFILQ
jgi:hypothetical protein